MQKAQEVSRFNRKSSWVTPVLLVQRADHVLCFPKHKSLLEGRNAHVIFMGNILWPWDQTLMLGHTQFVTLHI